MSPKDIVLRADAGKTIGYGHFIRSLALAGYLKEDFNCIFCTFNPSELHPTKYQLDEISKICIYKHIAAASLEDYNNEFVNSLKGNEIVVLDNYYFQTEFQKKIRERGCRLVCIDDLHDRHMVADAVLTGCPLKESDFSLEQYTKFYGGLQHSFLREPFLLSRRKERENNQLKNIVVAIGGADPYGLTGKTIDILCNIPHKLNIAVIAGDTVEIEADDNRNVRIFHRLAAQEIVDLFNWADLGIFPASTICIEALACHLPIAAGWYVDNQKEFYQYGVTHGLFTPLGNFLQEGETLKELIMEVLKSPIMPQKDIDFLSGKLDIIRLFKTL